MSVRTIRAAIDATRAALRRNCAIIAGCGG